jgi:multidrug efflux pump subunit AcrB
VSKKLYQPLLARALEWRYLTVSIAVAALIIALGAIASGRIGLQFFPSIERDRIQATLTMPFGTPIETTEAIIERMQVAAEALREEADRELDEDRSVVTTIQSTLGRHGTGFGGPRPADSSPGQAHLGEVALALLPATERDMSTAALVARWRELTGPVPEAVELRFSATGIGAGQAIDVQLAGRDLDELRDAAAEVGEVLAGYDGVFDISDSFRAGKREIKLTILPTAKPLGLTQSDLARQVREAFYGAEVQRIQRGSEDIRVMVRYPEAERRSIGDLEDLRIRTADGTEVPFSTVARAEYGYGYASIRRTDRRRVVSVIGEVDRSRTSPEEVLASLERTKLPEILARHPGVTYSLEGEQRERVTSLDGLVRGFGIALLVIYALLAIPLRSYLQPFVIMSAIPFGAIGAIVGHVIMGWDLVFFSMLGIVALSGVVVNDSLILVDFVNRKRKEGLELIEAVRLAGATRFRAIVLTSLTTLVGLLPLIFNRNPIIFPLVPISISLGFGIVFATVITLVLVPCAYVVLEDLRPRPRPVAEAERDTDQGPVGALPSKG